jgi:hypothetical protein
MTNAPLQRRNFVSNLLPSFVLSAQVILSTPAMADEVLCYSPTEDQCFRREGFCDISKSIIITGEAGREFCLKKSIDSKRRAWCLPYSNMNKAFRSATNNCPPDTMTLTDEQAVHFK